jgi:tetratricopeptide (TPR) repeat protein
MGSAALDNTRGTTGAPPSTVLFLAANPVRVPLLQLGEECRAIEAKIRAAKFRDQLRFRSRWAARPDDLLQALHEDDPTVLHFSGHGAGAQGLCFLADDGGVLRVSSDGLSQVIRAAGDSIQLVVLNACYTKVQAEALVAHVPCVIGMPDQIGDKAAIIYAAELYRALAFGKSVANAHQCGLAALSIHSASGQPRDIDAAEAALRTPPPELLMRADVDPRHIHVVRSPQSIPAAPTAPSEPRIHLEIDIDADFEAIDANTISQIVSEIRRLSGGRPVRILCVTKGSIRLSLSLEPEAASVVMALRDNGRLAQICGHTITNIVELGRVEISPQSLELGLRLIASGEREPTLTTAHEAVALYRSLAARNPDMFQPALATGLHHLGVRLCEAGRRDPALDALREAVELHRTLAAYAPGKVHPDFAACLRDLGLLLRELGQHEPAFVITGETVELYRTLAESDPDRFQPALARALHDLGIMARALDRYGTALNAMHDATRLRRILAARSPEDHQRDLARSLHNLGILEGEIFHPEPALAATREAVDLHRAAAMHDPDHALPDLAGSLNNLANRLRELGQHEPALAAIREAVDLHRALAARNPDRFQSELATSLHNLGIIQHELGAHEPALLAVREGVAVHRALAARAPDRFQSDLAENLNRLSHWQLALGQREDALETALEAVNVYRTLAARAPDRFRPDLADSLNQLSNRLLEIDRRTDSLAAAFEAVELYRSLAAHAPDRFQPVLAESLTNLGVDLYGLGRRNDALTATCEAVEVYLALRQRHPDRFESDLARSVHNRDAIRAPQPTMSALPQRRTAHMSQPASVPIERTLQPDRFSNN